MTIKLQSIQRYPVKGLSPQFLEQIELEKNRPMAWDRAFAIENGPCGFDAGNPGHLSKVRFLMLMKQPELARLKTDFDPESGELTLSQNGEVEVKGNVLTGEGTKEIETFLAGFCEKRLRGTPKFLHAPGHAFTDSRTQDLTLINLATIKELSQKAGAELDPIRFRGNLHISGAEPWQEFDWIGQEITIGSVRFTVRKRTERCPATNANPETGIADQSIPRLLLKTYGHADCGIHLMPLNNGPIKCDDVLTIMS